VDSRFTYADWPSRTVRSASFLNSRGHCRRGVMDRPPDFRAPTFDIGTALLKSSRISESPVRKNRRSSGFRGLQLELDLTSMKTTRLCRKP
jgi:hypothetical protein